MSQFFNLLEELTDYINESETPEQLSLMMLGYVIGVATKTGGLTIEQIGQLWPGVEDEDDDEGGDRVSPPFGLVPLPLTPVDGKRLEFSATVQKPFRPKRFLINGAESEMQSVNVVSARIEPGDRDSIELFSELEEEDGSIPAERFGPRAFGVYLPDAPPMEPGASIVVEFDRLTSLDVLVLGIQLD